MKTAPRLDLIICTRHRPAELSAVLSSVGRQLAIPALVVVVDSSDDDLSRSIVERRAEQWPDGSTLQYLHAGPGLPHQRNVGIEATSNEIICFLDDDVELEPDYFTAIASAFSADSAHEIGGVGATILNQPARPRLWKLDAALGLDSPIEGVVLRTGRNVRVVTPKQESLRVEWLAGLATAYRREVFAEHRPNEMLTVEGEDVEFSYRVAQDWQLVVLADARVSHTESLMNRPDRAESAARELWVRHLRCSDRTGILKMRWFWIGVCLQLFRALLTGVVVSEQRSIARGTLRGIRKIRAAESS